MKELARTLLAPWRRITEEKKDMFTVEDLISRIIINTLMRLVGFLVRSFVIAVGLLMVLLCTAFFLVAGAAWLVLPFVIPVTFVVGLVMVFL